MTQMRIGDVYRYPRERQPHVTEIDGRPNFYHAVHTPGRALPQLERGIFGIARVTLADQSKRRPAVLIRSSPHKVGSELTPWQDVLDVDYGHVSYYGDRKPSNPKRPELVSGNKLLLEEFNLHSSSEKTNEPKPPLFSFSGGLPSPASPRGSSSFKDSQS